MLRAITTFILLGAVTTAAACLGPDTLPFGAPEAPPEAPEPVGEGDEVELDEDLCEPTTLLGDGRPERVRVVIAADRSGSLQFVDQNDHWREALYELLIGLAQLRDVDVATIGMGSVTYAYPGAEEEDAFTPAPDWVEPPFLREVSVMTDLQGGLERIVDKITRDLDAMTTAERAETSYLVLLLTDGSPSPTCCAEGDALVGERVAAEGCVALPASEGVRYCGASMEADLCEDAAVLEQARANAAIDPSADWYDATSPLPGLEVGEAYNRPEQLEGLAAKLRALPQSHGAREVRLSIGMLVNPSLEPEVAEVMDLDSCSAAAQLAPVAAAGGGRVVTYDTRTPFTFDELLHGCADE